MQQLVKFLVAAMKNTKHALRHIGTKGDGDRLCKRSTYHKKQEFERLA